MRLMLTVLAVVLLLAGCGQANAPKDPFVGTWRSVDEAGIVVTIARAHDGYSVTTIWLGRPDNRAILTRHQGELVGTVAVPTIVDFAGKTWRMTVTYMPLNHELFLKVGNRPGTSFFQASTSTLVPTPSP
jgi:hypothetical protein